MHVANLVVGLACTVTALLTIGLSVPALRPDSDWTIINGIQRPDGFASDRAWRRLNRFAARRMILWSLSVLALGIVGFFVPFEEQLWLSLDFGMAPLLILGAAVETWRYARREREGG
jgi:hypothetical protein